MNYFVETVIDFIESGYTVIRNTIVIKEEDNRRSEYVPDIAISFRKNQIGKQ